MSEQDAYIREAQREGRRIGAEASMQWMRVRHAAGHRDYCDKVAMRQVKIVVTRAHAGGASWLDITAAVARVAARPADRKGYVYSLEDEIGNVAQERRGRERSEATTVEREQTRADHEERHERDLAELRAKHPGLSVREILRVEGLDPFHRTTRTGS